MKKEPNKQKEKLKINEIIVVEGRDDITAIKRVVDAHIIALNGFSALSKKTINKMIEFYLQILILQEKKFVIH